jgi:hypothetical protein
MELDRPLYSSQTPMATDFSYLIMAQQFLLTARNVLAEMVRQGNLWTVVAERPISNDELEERTRWSDFNTMVPTLFLFIHGTELLFKGIFEMRKIPYDRNHELSGLLSQVPAQDPCQSVVPVVRKYIGSTPDTPSFLRHYIENNRTISSPKRLYESLRYPETNSGLEFDQYYLRHNSESVLAEVEKLIADIDTILSTTVAAYRAASTDA